MLNKALTDEEAYAAYKKAEGVVNWFFQFFKDGKLENFLCSGKKGFDDALEFFYSQNGKDIEIVAAVNLDLERAAERKTK